MVVFAVDLGWPPWLGAFLGSRIAGMALIGAIFNLGVYYPLRNRTFLPVIISDDRRLDLPLPNTVLALYRPQPQVLPGWFDTPAFSSAAVYLDSQYLLIIGVTVLLGRLPVLVLRAHAARQEIAGDHARTRKWRRCSAFPSRR